MRKYPVKAKMPKYAIIIAPNEQQAAEADAAMGIVEDAFRQKRIGQRQYEAMRKHALRHTPEHIAKMLELMVHMTFRDAHREAVKAVGR